jgi:hypothetical protein
VHAVAAFTTPPRLSISMLMSAAVGRFAVPLNTMCSRKWLVPASRRLSMREPAPTKTASDAERVSGISETRMRTPFGRVRFRYSTAPNASIASGPP